MNILFVSIPISLLLLGVAVWAFFWAVRSGQYDDLDSPAYSILMEQKKPGQGEAGKQSDASAGESGQPGRDTRQQGPKQP